MLKCLKEAGNAETFRYTKGHFGHQIQSVMTYSRVAHSLEVSIFCILQISEYFSTLCDRQLSYAYKTGRKKPYNTLWEDNRDSDTCTSLDHPRNQLCA